MIRKAAIPVAGIGSRLLPLTKALPKEMLPILDKPVLQRTVEELALSGIEDITIVISGKKQLIQQHFAPDEDLEMRLRAEGKDGYADELRRLSSLARITYVYQDGPYGNGTPVLNAARVIGDEPFLVVWGDDVFTSSVPRARQLVEAFESTNAPVIGLMTVAPEEVSRYGMAMVSEDTGDPTVRVTGLVEKPAPDRTPSLYASIGGYVVTPAIVDSLRSRVKDHSRDDGEVYLSAAVDECARTGRLYGRVIDATWWDTGNPTGYLLAQVAAALKHPEFGPEIRKLFIESQDPSGPRE